MRHRQGTIVSGPESSPSFTNWRDKASGFTLVGDASLSSHTPSFYDLSNQERIHHCQCHNFSVEDDERSTRMRLIIDRQERCDRTASIPTLENPPVSGQSFGRKSAADFPSAQLHTGRCSRGLSLSSLEDLYSAHCSRKAGNILRDVLSLSCCPRADVSGH